MIIKIILFILVCDTTCGFSVEEVQQYANCLSHCLDEPCRDGCIQNDILNKTTRISNETVNFNGTLHCRDTDLLSIKHNPGLYLIEVENENTWQQTSVIQGGISIFPNLTPDTSYRYRAWKFDQNNVISASEFTTWYRTAKRKNKPSPVKSIQVENILGDDVDDDHLMAQIVFEPGEDRSCLYNVLSLHEDDGLSIGQVNATREFRFTLHSLEYERNTTLIISARNSGNPEASDNVTLTFKTPTCLSIFQSLQKCRPDQVTGLKIEELQDDEDDDNFLLSWDSPEFIPDNYTIRICTIDDAATPHFITIPGNVTEVRYSTNEAGKRHIISIIAESRGGSSLPVSISNAPKSEIYVSSSISYNTLIALSCATVVVALITGIYICCRYKKLKNCKNPYRYCTNFHERTFFNLVYDKPKLTEIDNKIEDHPLINKDSFELHPDQLRIKAMLGCGFSGVVHLGSLKINETETKDVAIKMLRDCPTAEDLKNFQREMLVMKAAGKHPNIVSLIGCCTSEIRPMLVVEYCSKGDLQTYLRSIWEGIIEDSAKRKVKCNLITHIDNNETTLLSPEYENIQDVAVSNQLYDIQQDMLNSTEDITVTDLLSFAVQIANGMEFLSLNRIVHRDLAARNVLVCNEKIVKIADFGLSRDIYQENVYKKQGDGKLPLKWMAIEALTHQVYTTQSDVWSFGILLWEIVTLGCNPYPGTPTHMILQVLKTGYRMERPQNCGKELYDIMLSCWRTRPLSRPTFTELKESLEKLLQSVSHHNYLNLYDILKESTKIT